MDEVFVYSCPSCGGKVEYVNNKWHCTYCNNTYDALFVEESKKLPDLKIQKYTMYHYKCSKCNNTFVSLDEKNAKCNFCNEVADGIGEKFIASNIIDTDIVLDEAKEIYLKEIKRFSKKIDNNYFKLNLIDEYIYCNLYNGCIKIMYDNFVEKYFLINLLIPNIKDDNYKFMYEIGNNGLSSNEILKISDITNEIISNSNCISKIHNINYEDDIVSECIEVFSKKYKISNKNNIKVEKDIEVSEGVFFPVYKNKVIVNNKEYNQYVVGNSHISKKGSTILDFPNEKDSMKKYRKYDFLFSTILYNIMMCVFIIMMFSPILFTQNISKILYIIPIMLFIIFIVSVILRYYTKKKRDYYYNTIKVSKKEFFNQIITNSNYVKIIEVKK